MTDFDLEAWGRRVLDQAYEFRATQDVMPTWFAYSGKAMNIIGTPFYQEVPDAKEISAEGVALILSQMDPRPEAVMFVTDAWVRAVPPGDDYDPRVSRHPEAVECLVVNCWTRDRKGFVLMRRYRTRDDGSLERLDAEDLAVGEGETGTFEAVVNELRR